jgi:ribonuclease HII
MQIPTFEREANLARQGIVPIGVDEAGRGPLAGPVVAAAVAFKDPSFVVPLEREKEFKLIRDSKKLSEKQREVVYALVEEQFYVGIGIIGPETIDRVNILQATFLAMRSAISELQRNMKHEIRNMGKEKLVLLIDGNQTIPNISMEQEAIVNGDSLVRSIAAASIVAKVTRDRIITEADALYPGYGLALHKGYGTALHMAALRKLGPSPIHRMSFRPVQLAIPENVNRRFANVLKPKK